MFDHIDYMARRFVVFLVLSVILSISCTRDCATADITKNKAFCMRSGLSKNGTRRISFAIVHLQSRRFPTRLACGVVTAELAVPKAAVVLAPGVSDFDRSTDECTWIPFPYPPYIQ